MATVCLSMVSNGVSTQYVGWLSESGWQEWCKQGARSGVYERRHELPEAFHSFHLLRAPRRSGVGSRSARPVAMAYRMAWPMLASARCAVSRAPRVSIWRTSSRTKGGVMLATGGRPVRGHTSRPSRAMIRSAWLVLQVGRYFSNHSRATISKLLAARSTPAAFSAFRLALGSMPAAISFRAASRRSRASARKRPGSHPGPATFPFPHACT
jgi:hypothetical protein